MYEDSLCDKSFHESSNKVFPNYFGNDFDLATAQILVKRVYKRLVKYREE